FSSRRRHTRSKRDWSSDVCSSDLAEFLSLILMTAFLVVFSTFKDAPFRELANPSLTPNPSKAPWYFLGLQELLRYFHPQVAGVRSEERRVGKECSCRVWACGDSAI